MYFLLTNQNNNLAETRKSNFFLIINMPKASNKIKISIPKYKQAVRAKHLTAADSLVFPNRLIRCYRAMLVSKVHDSNLIKNAFFGYINW